MTPPAAGDAAARSRSRKRLFLILWLLAPLAAVLLLWLTVDRSKGRPDPDRMRSVPAGPGIPPEGSDADR